MTEDLTKRCGSFNFENCRYAGRERMQICIIKRLHVKSINVIIKHVTKGIQRIEDMDIPVNFRQKCYTITKRSIKKGQRNTEKK